MSRYGYRFKLTAIAALGAVFAAAAAVPAAPADGRHPDGRHDGRHDRRWYSHDHRAHVKHKVVRIERRIIHPVRPRVQTRYVIERTKIIYKPVIVRPQPKKVYWYKTNTYRTYHTSGTGISNETGGRLIGAVLGAVVGSQFGKGKGKLVAVAGGTLVGALIGGEIGSRMDANDRARSQQVLESVPTGKTVNWVNPDTGASYEMTPTNTYRDANNVDCRDYTTWVFIDGYEEQVHGTACRAADGTWLPMNKG